MTTSGTHMLLCTSGNTCLNVCINFQFTDFKIVSEKCTVSLLFFLYKSRVKNPETLFEYATTRCCIPSFNGMGNLVSKKMYFKGCYDILA